MSIVEDTLGNEILVGSGHPVLPRVNLLPPEIAERRRFRRVQLGLGAVVLASVGVMGLLYVAAVGNGHDAESALRDATAEGQAIQAQQAEYADVSTVYARAEAAEVMLTQAMGEEVRYSAHLHELARSVPDKVWLKNVTFSQTPAPPAVGDATPGIGTVSFTGVGFKHGDVATWLESLAAHEGFARPYLTSSTESLIGDRVTVDFVSNVVLTPDSLSRRYTTPEGN